jgi:uncharacterized protein (DUF2461 family)
MNVEKILEQTKEDYTHKYTDPLERLEANSDKALKYAEKLFRVNRAKNKLRILVDAKYSELYKNAKYNSAFLCKSKQDAEAFIDTDEEYQKLKNQLTDLENLSLLFDNLVNIYRQREATERLIFKAKTGVGE